MNLKKKLADGHSIVGTMLQANSPAIVEVLGILGFDYVLIDLQHTPATWETAQDLIRAAHLRNMAALIRIPAFTETDILKALDIGADGLILPFLRTADELRFAVGCSRYLPEGNRSICSQTRLASYGLYDGTYVDLLKRINSNTFLFGVVEDQTGVDNLADIMAVAPGLDVISVGRGDLAAGMGLAGQQSDPRLLAVVNHAVDVIMNPAPSIAQPPCMGVFTYSKTELPGWHEKGARAFCHMSEVSLLANGSRDYLSALQR